MKTTKSISVEQSDWDRFISITNALNVSASSLLQDFIKDYNSKNEDPARAEVAEFWGLENNLKQ